MCPFFRVDLTGWGKATRERAGLGQVMLLDEVGDPMLPRYLVTKMAPTWWREP